MRRLYYYRGEVARITGLSNEQIENYVSRCELTIKRNRSRQMIFTGDDVKTLMGIRFLVHEKGIRLSVINKNLQELLEKEYFSLFDEKSISFPEAAKNDVQHTGRSSAR